MNSIKLGNSNHWATIFFTACSHTLGNYTVQVSLQAHTRAQLNTKPCDLAFVQDISSENRMSHSIPQQRQRIELPEESPFIQILRQRRLNGQWAWCIWQINMSMNIFQHLFAFFSNSIHFSLQIILSALHFEWKVNPIKHISHIKRPLNGQHDQNFPEKPVAHNLHMHDWWFILF